ncbi:MAG: PQQ-binding-like beta-propeller repeat protein [Gemmatimonadales bacterium]
MTSRVCVVIATALFGVVPHAHDADLIAQRRVVIAELSAKNQLWEVGGESEALVTPNRMVLVDTLLIVTDPREPRIDALDVRTGRTVWQYARVGGGPNEIRQPFLASWHPRGVAVVDNQNRRVLLLSMQGRPLAEASVPGGLFVAGLCGLKGGDLVVHVPDPNGSGLILFGLGKAAPRNLGDPFPVSSLSISERSVDLASTESMGGDHCLVTRRIADGFALIHSNGTGVAGQFIERLTQRRLLPPPQIRDTSQLPIQFGLRGTVTGNTAVVRFGGKTRCAFKCLDLYALPDMSYQRTIQLDMQLPIRMRDIVLAPGHIIVLGTRNDLPVITAFSVPPSVVPR